MRSTILTVRDDQHENAVQDELPERDLDVELRIRVLEHLPGGPHPRHDLGANALGGLPLSILRGCDEVGLRVLRAPSNGLLRSGGLTNCF